MASQDETTDVTECTICFELYEDPRSLPCLHTFCLECIRGVCQQDMFRNRVPCPVCRKEFQIPRNGVDDLPHNFVIQKLIDQRKTFLGQAASGTLCEVCQADTPAQAYSINPATIYCLDCDRKLCIPCSKPCKTRRGGRHQLKPLGAELEAEITQIRSSYCDKHYDKRLELFCFTCSTNICMMCFALQHQQHKCEEIPKAAEKMKPEMQRDIKQVSIRTQEVEKWDKDLDGQIEKYAAHMNQVRLKIRKEGDRAKQLVDKEVSDLVKEAESIESENIKKMKALKDDVQLALVSLMSFQRYSEGIQTKGSPVDITRVASELHNRTKELLQTDVTSSSFELPTVSFIEELKRVKVVGEIIVDMPVDKQRVVIKFEADGTFCQIGDLIL